MELRTAMQSDFDFMLAQSINKEADRSIMECVDYLYTLEHEGIPMFVGGFRMIVPTTAWCWVDLSEEAIQRIPSVYRSMKSWIRTFTKTHGIKRLQAFVRDNEKNIRMIEHLGFTKESTMKDFFGNEDAYMYAWRPNGNER